MEILKGKMDHLFVKKITIENGKEFVFPIPRSGNVGCMVSGGADSAILLYVLAKTIVDEGLETQVYPVTAEMLKRPYNIRFSSEVIRIVEELTGFVLNLI